ncbi:MAG: hypothetical protein R2880_13340 [Deinococcales bacterium]
MKVFRKLLWSLVCIQGLALTLAQDAESVIRQALEAHLSVPHMRSVIEGNTTSSDPEMPAFLLGKSKVIQEFVAPDSFRMTMYDADGKLMSDTIILKTGSYDLNEAGVWEAGEPELHELSMMAREMSVKELVIRNVQQLADESFEGVLCAVYSYESELRTIISQNKVWIDKVTGLMVGMEGSSTLSPTLHTTSRATFDYTTPITITAPF